MGVYEFICSLSVLHLDGWDTEFMDLSNEEKEEILEFVREKAVCKSEDAHGILEIAFQMVFDIAMLIDHVFDLSGHLKSLKAA